MPLGAEVSCAMRARTSMNYVCLCPPLLPRSLLPAPKGDIPGDTESPRSTQLGPCDHARAPQAFPSRRGLLAPAHSNSTHHLSAACLPPHPPLARPEAIPAAPAPAAARISFEHVPQVYDKCIILTRDHDHSAMILK